MNIYSQEQKNNKNSKKPFQPENDFYKKERKNLKSSFSSKFSFFLMTFFLTTFLAVAFGFLASETANKSLKNKLEELSEKIAQLEKEKEKEMVFSQEEEKATISVVKDNLPAVVSVVVTKNVPLLEEYFFDPFNFFGFDRPRSPKEPKTEKREIGGGSGFIVDKDGYIITNRHVVEDEEAEYTVILSTGEKFDAKVLAKDDFLDIAILKISANNLPIVNLGNSEKLEIGQTVIAIGNSLGEFQNSVSKGIISGLKRRISASDSIGKSETLDQVIQTDAAINPGNSGGPLLNLRGEVIGVNVAMAEGAENIGFAIPINDIKEIYESIKQTGQISRPYLGIRYMLINQAIQKENNLPFDYGALVVRGSELTQLAVIPGSPADKAGLRENDIILEVDGVKIDEKNDLAGIIRRKKIGQEVVLKVWSQGKEKMLTIVLEEASS